MSSLPPNTNIWIAASEGNQSLVDEFFQSDSTLTPTSKDPNTYTPLHAAASYAHHDLLRWLLKHERATPNDVNITDADGDTPLFVVEDAETARILIEEFKADAKHKNQEGLTAAQNAYENGFEDVAQYVRGVTGEPAPTLEEEEDDDDEEQDQEHQGQAAAGVHDTDDLKHDGETTKRYVQLLQEYTSCEISDALIKLKHPTGGHLPNINLTSPNPMTSTQTKLCGQVYPISMVASTDTSAPPKPTTHFVDSAPSQSILVIQAPSNAHNAVWGGLMTARAQFKGVKGVIIDGKCRDLTEHWQAGFPVFSKGHSTLGQAPFTRPGKVGCPLTFPLPSNNGDTASASSNADPAFPAATLHPQDLILADVDGVVFVPRNLVTQVVELAEKGRKVDELCMSDLKGGRAVDETFKDRRGK